MMMRQRDDWEEGQWLGEETSLHSYPPIRETEISSPQGRVMSGIMSLFVGAVSQVSGLEDSADRRDEGRV